ncbi:hypothetical protein [Arthrobacter sp. 92]
MEPRSQSADSIAMPRRGHVDNQRRHSPDAHITSRRANYPALLEFP